MIKLYHYWRSSASWRVRWALAYKNIPVEYIPVNLLTGENESPEHLQRNPLGFVPVLQVDDNYFLESVSIIEWLEEKYPQRNLFPKSALEKARARTLVELINSDTHPIQNLTVLERYSDDLEKRKDWARHFIHRGLSAYEKLAAQTAGHFSMGDQVSVADLFLVPQIYNGLRFSVDMSEFAILKNIYERCLNLPEVIATHPEKFQPA